MERFFFFKHLEFCNHQQRLNHPYFCEVKEKRTRRATEQNPHTKVFSCLSRVLPVHQREAEERRCCLVKQSLISVGFSPWKGFLLREGFLLTGLPNPPPSLLQGLVADSRDPAVALAEMPGSQNIRNAAPLRRVCESLWDAGNEPEAGIISPLFLLGNG